MPTINVTISDEENNNLIRLKKIKRKSKRELMREGLERLIEIEKKKADGFVCVWVRKDEYAQKKLEFD